MADKRLSPLQASFWLTEQEKRSILVICALFLVGLASRYYYLKSEISTVYTPAGIEELETENE